MTADYHPTRYTLGDIDDRCALTGEDPLELLDLLMSARQVVAHPLSGGVPVVA